MDDQAVDSRTASPHLQEERTILPETGEPVSHPEKNGRNGRSRRRRRSSRTDREEETLRVTYACVTHSEAAYETLLQILAEQVVDLPEREAREIESPKEQRGQASSVGG